MHKSLIFAVIGTIFSLNVFAKNQPDVVVHRGTKDVYCKHSDASGKITIIEPPFVIREGECIAAFGAPSSQPQLDKPIQIKQIKAD
jgi:hypothetical protein